MKILVTGSTGHLGEALMRTLEHSDQSGTLNLLEVAARQNYDDANLMVNEFLYRRADIEDVVSAHMLAVQKACAQVRK